MADQTALRLRLAFTKAVQPRASGASPPVHRCWYDLCAQCADSVFCCRLGHTGRFARPPAEDVWLLHKGSMPNLQLDIVPPRFQMPAGLATAGDLAAAVAEEFSLSVRGAEELQLVMDGFAVLPGSAVDVIRDGDLVNVQRVPRQRAAGKAAGGMITDKPAAALLGPPAAAAGQQSRKRKAAAPAEQARPAKKPAAAAAAPAAAAPAEEWSSSDDSSSEESSSSEEDSDEDSSSSGV